MATRLSFLISIQIGTGCGTNLLKYESNFLNISWYDQYIVEYYNQLIAWAEYASKNINK